MVGGTKQQLIDRIMQYEERPPADRCRERADPEDLAVEEVPRARIAGPHHAPFRAPGRSERSAPPSNPTPSSLSQWHRRHPFMRSAARSEIRNHHDTPHSRPRPPRRSLAAS